jgi:hypothetical protein
MRLRDSSGNVNNKDAGYVENQQQHIADAIDLLPRLAAGIDLISRSMILQLQLDGSPIMPLWENLLLLKHGTLKLYQRIIQKKSEAAKIMLVVPKLVDPPSIPKGLGLVLALCCIFAIRTLLLAR